MKKYSPEYIAYNNFCYDVGYINNEHCKFNKTVFLSSLLCITGSGLVTEFNNFKDDLISIGMKSIPTFIMFFQLYRLAKDTKERQESTYYIQILCDELEKKGIYINLENFKDAIFNEEKLLYSIKLNNDATFCLDDNTINYVDGQIKVDVTDEVAESCLSIKELSQYKKNKMGK